MVEIIMNGIEVQRGKGTATILTVEKFNKFNEQGKIKYIDGKPVLI